MAAYQRLMHNKLSLIAALVLLTGLTVAPGAGAAGAPQAGKAPAAQASAPHPSPLSADDISLLLIGGASPQKMIVLIHQRGVDFALNPNIVKQFYQDGATDAVIDALQKASEALRAQPAAAPAPPRPSTAPAPPTPTAPASPSPQPAANAPVKPEETKPAANSPPPISNAPLPDPSPERIKQIIQEFAAKEKLFEDALQNYTYHQINKAETIDANGNVNGVWEQDWDILFGPSGKRLVQVTYAPESTLAGGLMVTEQDIKGFQSLQPFTVTTDTLPEYDIKYLGHVHVDYITCYVFSVRPKEIKKNHIYFKGVVWVDDHDIQVVKAEGRIVPQTMSNSFPRFTTWRQQIDGKYWFPTFTSADDTLYFKNGAPPVHIREIIKYTNYKQFKSKFKILSSTPITQPSPATPAKH